MKRIQPNLLAAVVCFIVLLFAVLGLLACNRIFLGQITSDALYLVSLYQDLFVDHYRISGWNVPPAPYFFPDMILFFPILWVSGDIGYGFVVYSVIFLLLFLLVLIKIAANLKIRLLYSSVTFCLAALLLVALSQNEKYAKLFFHFFYPSFHSGTVLGGFLLVALSLEILHQEFSFIRGIMLFLLSFLLTASDLLIVPQFLLPLVITMFLFAISHNARLRVWLIYSGVTAAAALIARFFLQALVAEDIINVPTVFAGISLEAGVLLARFAAFFRDMRTYVFTYPLLAMTAAGWLSAALVHLVKFRRLLNFSKESDTADRRKIRPLLFLILFSVISVLGTLVSPAAINRWEPWCINYLQPAYLIPVLLIFIFFARLADEYLLLFTAASGAVFIFSVLMIGLGIRTLDMADLRLPYPKLVQRLDEIAEAFELRSGYGDYWTAKYATVMSRRGVRVNQLKEDGSIDPWINNMWWYRYEPPTGESKYPLYQFILFTPPLGPEIERKFGTPAFQEYIHGRVIYVYNRKGDVAFRNFLRLSSAMAVAAELPASPTSPADLSQYKPNGTRWDSPGAVIIPEGGELPVEFDGQISGEVLEIAADGDDEYMIRFTKHETPLGSELIVPATSQRNMQIRYLTLPDSLRDKPFDRLLIRPRKGDGKYSIGHIFLYNDTY